MKDLRDALVGAGRDLFDRLLDQLPNIIGAALLMLVGWAIARLVRMLAARGLRLLDGMIHHTGESRTAQTARLSVELFADLLFWAVLLVFVTGATQLLGLGIFTDWLSRFVAYIPTLAVGVLIIVAGIVLAGFARTLVLSTTSRLAEPQRIALARGAQGATLLLALLVGADQIGIRVTWLAILVAIVVTAILGGAVVALSLGARGFVSNLIGAHYLRQSFRIGETVRVAGHEGRIVDFTATSLLLETAEGRVNLPARVYNEEPIVLLAQVRDD